MLQRYSTMLNELCIPDFDSVVVAVVSAVF